MRPLHKSFIALTAICTLFALSVGQTPPPARALAVVNISKVFSSLNEQIDGTTEIENLNTQFKSEQQKKEQELEKLSEQLGSDVFQKDSPEYRKMADDALQKRADYDAFLNVCRQKIMIEERLKTIAIYRRMNESIKQFAQENGIGLILVADEINFDRVNTIEGVQQSISNRKIIYAHPDFDITQKIIEKMNANYKLGHK